MPLAATLTDDFGPFAFAPEVLGPCHVPKMIENQHYHTQVQTYVHQPCDHDAALQYAYGTTSARQLCLGIETSNDDGKGSVNIDSSTNKTAWISGCRITADHLSKAHYMDYKALGIPVTAEVPETPGADETEVAVVPYNPKASKLFALATFFRIGMGLTLKVQMLPSVDKFQGGFVQVDNVTNWVNADDQGRYGYDFQSTMQAKISSGKLVQPFNGFDHFESANTDVTVEAEDYFASVDYTKGDPSKTIGAQKLAHASVQFYMDTTNQYIDAPAGISMLAGYSLAVVMSEYEPPYYNSFFATNDPTYHAQLPKINVNVGNSFIWHTDPAQWEEIMRKQDMHMMPLVSPQYKTRALNVGKFWSESNTVSKVSGISFEHKYAGDGYNQYTGQMYEDFLALFMTDDSEIEIFRQFNKLPSDPMALFAANYQDFEGCFVYKKDIDPTFKGVTGVRTGEKKRQFMTASYARNPNAYRDFHITFLNKGTIKELSECTHMFGRPGMTYGASGWVQAKDAVSDVGVPDTETLFAMIESQELLFAGHFTTKQGITLSSIPFTMDAIRHVTLHDAIIPFLMENASDQVAEFVKNNITTIKDTFKEAASLGLSLAMATVFDKIGMPKCAAASKAVFMVLASKFGDQKAAAFVRRANSQIAQNLKTLTKDSKLSSVVSWMADKVEGEVAARAAPRAPSQLSGFFNLSEDLQAAQFEADVASEVDAAAKAITNESTAISFTESLLVYNEAELCNVAGYIGKVGPSLLEGAATLVVALGIQMIMDIIQQKAQEAANEREVAAEEQKLKDQESKFLSAVIGLDPFESQDIQFTEMTEVTFKDVAGKILSNQLSLSLISPDWMKANAGSLGCKIIEQCELIRCLKLVNYYMQESEIDYDASLVKIHQNVDRFLVFKTQRPWPPVPGDLLTTQHDVMTPIPTTVFASQGNPVGWATNKGNEDTFRAAMAKSYGYFPTLITTKRGMVTSTVEPMPVWVGFAKSPTGFVSSEDEKQVWPTVAHNSSAISASSKPTDMTGKQCKPPPTLADNYDLSSLDKTCFLLLQTSATGICLRARRDGTARQFTNNSGRDVAFITFGMSTQVIGFDATWNRTTSDFGKPVQQRGEVQYHWKTVGAGKSITYPGLLKSVAVAFEMDASTMVPAMRMSTRSIIVTNVPSDAELSCTLNGAAVSCAPLTRLLSDIAHVFVIETENNPQYTELNALFADFKAKAPGCVNVCTISAWLSATVKQNTQKVGDVTYPIISPIEPEKQKALHKTVTDAIAITDFRQPDDMKKWLDENYDANIKAETKARPIAPAGTTPATVIPATGTPAASGPPATPPALQPGRAPDMPSLTPTRHTERPTVKQAAVGQVKLPPISLYVPFANLWAQIGMGLSESDPRIAPEVAAWRALIDYAVKRQDDSGVFHAREEWRDILEAEVYPILENRAHGTSAALRSPNLKELLAKAERARRARIALFRLAERELPKSTVMPETQGQMLELISSIYEATLNRAEERLYPDTLDESRMKGLLDAASMAIASLSMPVKKRSSFMLEHGHEWKLATNLASPHISVFMHAKKFKYRGVEGPCLLVAVGASSPSQWAQQRPPPAPDPEDATYMAAYTVLQLQSNPQVNASVQDAYAELQIVLHKLGKDMHSFPVYLCAHGRGFPACLQFLRNSRVKHIVGLQPMQLLSDEYAAAFTSLSTNKRARMKTGARTDDGAVRLGKDMGNKVVTFRYDSGKLYTADPMSCLSGVFGHTTIVYDTQNVGLEMQEAPWPLDGKFI